MEKKKTTKLYNLLVDSKKYKKKPSQKEIIKINSRIVKDNEKSITVKELAELQSSGYTTMPSIMKGSRKKINFEQAQFVFIDVDNTSKIIEGEVVSEGLVTIKDIMSNEFVKENASHIYKTFSYTEKKPKFRIVFPLSEIVFDITTYLNIIQKMLKLFPIADSSCSDVSRLYFGGFEYIEINFENKLNVANFIKLQLPNIENNSVVQDYKNHKKVASLNHSFGSFNKSKSILYDTEYNENAITNIIKSYSHKEYADYLKSIDVSFPEKFENRKELIYEINKINPKLLLGIENESNFRCVLTADNNPSASVFKIPKSDVWLYIRFGENLIKFTNIEVFKCLLDTDSLDKVLTFFMKTFDMEYSVASNLQHTYDMSLLLVDFLQDKNMKASYPAIHKIIGKFNNHISDYILYTINNPYWNRESEMTIYLNSTSGNRLLNNLMLPNTKHQVNKIYKILNLASYLKIFTKIDVDNYPKYLKNIFIQNKTNSANKLNNVFVINYDNFKTFDSLISELNKSCEYLISVGFSFQSFNKDFIHLVDGQEDSNKIFTQNKNKSLNNDVLNLKLDIQDIVIDLFDSGSSFVLETDIKKILTDKYSQNRLATDFSSSILFVTSNNDWFRIRLTNKLKDYFKVSISGSPYALFPEKPSLH